LISVDLRKALLDAAERIIIQPNDISLLQYQKGEAALNLILDFFSYQFTLMRTN
jgi:hypothetical protein